MDLRTKLVLALVGVSLLSMAALGVLAYAELNSLLRTGLLRQLDALAESRRQELENVVDGWGDRVQLIGSRTRLRADLALHAETGSAELRAGIGRILEDAATSVPLVRSLDVYDAAGRRIASAPASGTYELTSEAMTFPPGEHSPQLLGLETHDGVPYAHYIMRLWFDDVEHVGWLEARLSAGDLAELAQDTTGLGTTGETLVVAPEGDGYRVLHPTRHGDGTPLPAASPRNPRDTTSVDPSQLAASGMNTVIGAGGVDYRGQAVWAATRYSDTLGWGIVVKVDATPEAASVNAARTRLIRGALAFAAFGILAGIMLAFHLAGPIHDLAEVANRIREGDTSARATVHHQDEIGMLARTFNRMADALTTGEGAFTAGPPGGVDDSEKDEPPDPDRSDADSHEGDAGADGVS